MKITIIAMKENNNSNYLVIVSKYLWESRFQFHLDDIKEKRYTTKLIEK
jgi:hypothetical protein